MTFRLSQFEVEKKLTYNRKSALQRAGIHIQCLPGTVGPNKNIIGCIVGNVGFIVFAALLANFMEVQHYC